MTMLQWLNSLPTIELIAMSRKLGCIYTGMFMVQRHVAINFLFSVSMSGTVPMTVAQFRQYYQSVVNETTPAIFELVPPSKENTNA
jgi:hypothetical protein